MRHDLSSFKLSIRLELALRTVQGAPWAESTGPSGNIHHIWQRVRQDSVGLAFLEGRTWAWQPRDPSLHQNQQGIRKRFQNQ